MTDGLRIARAAPWRLGFLVALLLAVPVHADPPPTARQQETEQKLQAVRARIAQLAEDQHQATARRDQINRKLVQQARALNRAAADLRASDTQLQQLQQQLHDLDQQQAAVQERLDQQQEALAELLRATYKLGHGSDLRILLGHVARCPPGRDQATDADCAPGERALARVQRALAYSRYFQADRARKIRSLLQELAARREISQKIAAQRLSIQKQREARRQQRDALQSEREKQRQLLARAEADISKRGQSIQSLEQDRKSLQGLLEQLRDVFADIPSTMPDDMPFSQRRGKLPWPVAGTPRKQKDGILIAVKAGTQVHAVAHGRVAYADWLRGYGMLLIIDHGHGWMSLYGGNESLLHGVGDWVNAGDRVATSGRGQGSVAGLYFGLRHKGRPVDPGGWLKKR